MKTLLFALLGPVIICTAFWLLGFNFDARGQTAAGCFALSVVAFILFGCLVCDIEDEEETEEEENEETTPVKD